MIDVLHFDYRRFESEGFRELLADELGRYPQVRYHDFMVDHCGYLGQHLAEIERLLPAKNVFLVHAGVIGQKAIKTFPEKFPHLRVAMVIPGDTQAYDPGIPIFCYHELDSIVEYVLKSRP